SSTARRRASTVRAMCRRGHVSSALITQCARVGVVLFVLAPGLLGCSRSDSRPTPLAPSAVQPVNPSAVQQPANPNQLIVFKDPLTGLSTSDVRDAQDHVVQFTTSGELVWTAEGTRPPGHFVSGPGYQGSRDAPGELSCQCWLVVRFGTNNGERRAYLTADYIHFNPRTAVALEIASGSLIVRRTDVFLPGTYTLSG